jgi:hypothetical protein
MTALTVDAAAMSAAIPQVESLVALLNGAASGLDCVAVPAGVPAGLAARVTSTTQSGAQSLRAEARALAGVPADLRSRAAAAGAADAPWLTAVGWGLRVAGLHFGSFTLEALSKPSSWGVALREIQAGLRSGETYGAGAWSAFRMTAATAEVASNLPHGVPAGLLKYADYGGKAVRVLGVAATAYSNIIDPDLTVEQKAGRTTATLATSAGVGVLADAATAAAFGTAAGGPVGALVAFGAVAGWSVLDNKFGVSRRIGDAAADAAVAVEDAGGTAAHAVGTGASATADAVGTGANAVGDGADKAADVVGDGADKAAGAIDDGADAVGDTLDDVFG